MPDGEGLRPTPDRVRETVFNWLAPYIEGAHVLEKLDLHSVAEVVLYAVRRGIVS